jgi:RND superfamily putative drug exporter
MPIPITGRIARQSARRPWLTLSVWAALLVVALMSAGTIGEHVTSAQKNLVTTEADRVAELDADLRASAGGEELFDESVIVTSAAHQYGDPAFDTAIAEVTTALHATRGVVDVVTPALGAPVAQNGTSAMVQFRTTADTAVVQAAVDAVNALKHDDVETFVFGTESAALAFTELAADELARGELFGLAAALVILVFVFGALVAAGLPLLVAIVSIITATGVGAVVARALDSAGVPISDSLTIFIAMLGLALGIDYSLLSVQRFREELAHGTSPTDAITTTGSTANRAVLFSGATIVVSLGALLLVPLNMFLGIGIGVILVAVTSVASALFLLPALLRLLGHRVNKGRVPMAHPGVESVRWRRLATRVVSRPALAAVLGVTVLAIAASPLLTINLANPGPDDMPEDFVAHRANEVLVEHFGWTDTATMVVITGAAGDADAVDALAAEVESDPGFADTMVDWRGTTAFIDTHDLYDAGDPESTEAIDRLRTVLIPSALAGSDATAAVGGTRAYAIDELELLTSRAPYAVAIVLTVTFLLLLVMFRSIVIPVKAIALNLLGTLATFGAVVATYQWGWGAALFGFPHLDGISPYMPVMIFALVFGLSMDYHVFLLARIKERYDATGDTKAAVIEGVTRTGPLITGAALIMVAVFSGFAVSAIPELSQWGFGLAVGVLLDAAVIRVLLVPAAMVWLGKANWYLPRWLEWLPTLTHEPTLAPTPDESREPALV